MIAQLPLTLSPSLGGPKRRSSKGVWGGLMLPFLLLQEGAPDMVTADDSGTLCVWQSGEEFKRVARIPTSG